MVLNTPTNAIRIFIALAFLMIASSSLSPAAEIYNNGQSNRLDGANISAYYAADDFTISTLSTIQQITIASSADYDPYPTTFNLVDWAVLADNAGVPGTLLTQGVSHAAFVDAGAQILGTEEFQLSLALGDASPVLVPGTYWLSLSVEEAGSLGQSIYWDTTGQAHGSAALTSAALEGPWSSSVSGASGTDLAFSLTGTVVTPEVSSFGSSAIGILALAILFRRSLFCSKQA